MTILLNFQHRQQKSWQHFARVHHSVIWEHSLNENNKKSRLEEKYTLDVTSLCTVLFLKLPPGLGGVYVCGGVCVCMYVCVYVCVCVFVCVCGVLYCAPVLNRMAKIIHVRVHTCIWVYDIS